MLNSYFENLREGAAGWYRFKDKFTGRLDTHSVNFEYKLVFDHPSGRKLRIIEYVAEVENCSKKEALAILGLTWEDYHYSVSFARRQPIINTIELPDYFRSITDGNDVFATRARSYLKNRNIKIDSAELLGIGYTYNGEYPGRIVIPIIIDGRCIAYTMRSFLGSPTRYIAKGQMGYCFFNQDALQIYKEIYLLEGIFDAIATGPQAIARNRLVPTDKQLPILKAATGVKKYKIICDADFEYKTGASFIGLIKSKQVEIAAMPEGYKDMDMLRDISKLNFIPLTYQTIFKWHKKLK